MTTTSSDQNDTDSPEVDTFPYIETLMESLSILGRLNAALEGISQRVATEVHSLVQVTLEEVDERYVHCPAQRSFADPSNNGKKTSQPHYQKP